MAGCDSFAVPQQEAEDPETLDLPATVLILQNQQCFRKLKLSQEPARSVLPPPAFVSGSALTLDHPTGRSGTECEAPSGILALIDAH